ncbi:MAG: hypothetical protein RL681_358 [Candidatus Parcubacteria bacterium]|jgi:oligoribonuclease NrnB/cAMP/cGMP phosphodiesterase (DHH superfamily)
MMRQEFKKNIVVIYHGGCSDGFGGAWAAWKKFGDKAHYYGASRGEPSLDYLRGKQIYLIDFSYSTEVVQKLIKNNVRVTAIDHHVSAEEATKLTKDYRYAAHHSGCVLAWRYFHPKKPVPRLLRHIEDIDLWRFKIPHTKAIRAYLETQDMNFKTWSALASRLERPEIRTSIQKLGELVLSYQERLCDELIAEGVELVQFGKYLTQAVNAPNFNSQNFTDLIADKLIRHRPPMAIVWKAGKKGTKVSLRSDGSADVGKLAARYGGGGHADSSAFRLPPGAKLPWTVVPEKKRR